MKKTFESELGQKREETVRHEPLGAPKKGRREQCTDENRGDKVGEQSGCVFQGC